jgi:hypothetical protein
MEQRKFENVIRGITEARTARRGALRLLLAGVATWPPTVAHRELAEAKSKKKKKRKKRGGSGDGAGGGGTCEHATACACHGRPDGTPGPLVALWCRTDIATAAECEAACPPAGLITVPEEFLVTRPDLGLKPYCGEDKDAHFAFC